MVHLYRSGTFSSQTFVCPWCLRTLCMNLTGSEWQPLRRFVKQCPHAPLPPSLCNFSEETSSTAAVLTGSRGCSHLVEEPQAADLPVHWRPSSAIGPSVVSLPTVCLGSLGFALPQLREMLCLCTVRMGWFSAP